MGGVAKRVLKCNRKDARTHTESETSQPKRRDPGACSARACRAGSATRVQTQLLLGSCCSLAKFGLSKIGTQLVRGLRVCMLQWHRSGFMRASVAHCDILSPGSRENCSCGELRLYCFWINPPTKWARCLGPGLVGSGDFCGILCLGFCACSSLWMQGFPGLKNRKMQRQLGVFETIRFQAEKALMLRESTRSGLHQLLMSHNSHHSSCHLIQTDGTSSLYLFRAVPASQPLENHSDSLKPTSAQEPVQAHVRVRRQLLVG